MIALDFVTTALLIPFVQTLAVPVDPVQQSQGGGVVAHCVIGGEDRTVSRAEVALHLAGRFRRGNDGKAAIEHLIDTELVRQAAIGEGVMPTDREVRARVRQIETGMRQQKRDLAKVLAAARMTEEDFLKVTALSLAHPRLAAKVLGLKDPAKVRPKHLELWTREQRNKVAIVTDAAMLPAGVMARVGKGEVTTMDVGHVLFTKMPKDGLRRAVEEIVFRRCIRHESKKHAIEIKPTDLEREFRKQERAFERSPRSQGVTYEKWLAAYGSSKKAKLASKTLLAALQHKRLVRKRYPDAELDRILERDREAVMRRHGTRRSMSIVLVRATNTPNKIVKRDFKKALLHITKIRRHIIDEKWTFAMMARAESDDPKSKEAGGAIGWQHQEYLPKSLDQKAPDEVLEAAFEMKIGKVSAPLRTARGYYLVLVSGIEPAPSQGTVRARLRREMAMRYNRELYENAKIRLVIR